MTSEVELFHDDTASISSLHLETVLNFALLKTISTSSISSDDFTYDGRKILSFQRRLHSPQMCQVNTTIPSQWSPQQLDLV